MVAIRKEKQEEIIQYVKDICSLEYVDVNFDKIRIEFGFVYQNITNNHTIIHDCVRIKDQENNIYFTVSGITDADVISKFIVSKYIEKIKCLHEINICGDSMVIATGGDNNEHKHKETK